MKGGPTIYTDLQPGQIPGIHWTTNAKWQTISERTPEILAKLSGWTWDPQRRDYRGWRDAYEAAYESITSPAKKVLFLGAAGMERVKDYVVRQREAKRIGELRVLGTELRSVDDLENQFSGAFTANRKFIEAVHYEVGGQVLGNVDATHLDRYLGHIGVVDTIKFEFPRTGTPAEKDYVKRMAKLKTEDEKLMRGLATTAKIVLKVDGKLQISEGGFPYRDTARWYNEKTGDARTTDDMKKQHGGQDWGALGYTYTTVAGMNLDKVITGHVANEKQFATAGTKSLGTQQLERTDPQQPPITFGDAVRHDYSLKKV